MESIDELIADRISGDSKPQTHELLRHMVFGEPYDQRLGSAYGYVFKHLCNRHGRMLDNRAWMPMGFEFFGDIERALARAGVSAGMFSLPRLISGQRHIALPPLDEAIMIGGFAEEEVGPAADVLAQADLNAITDAHERQAVRGLCTWLKCCAEQHRALVCFYH
jgi:hypothetical protein